MKRVPGIGYRRVSVAVVRLILALATVALTAIGSAQNDLAQPHLYISFFAGHSLRIFGSQDRRTDYGFGVSWQRHEPRFSGQHREAELVVDAYYEHSHSIDFSQGDGHVTDAIGVIWYGRFRITTGPAAFFVDIGEGGQMATDDTHDLGTRFNSSPMLGVGFSIRQGRQETLLGVRLLHLSNAHLNSVNRGQNQILFYTSVRF